MWVPEMTYQPDRALEAGLVLVLISVQAWALVVEFVPEVAQVVVAVVVVVETGHGQVLVVEPLFWGSSWSSWVLCCHTG